MSLLGIHMNLLLGPTVAVPAEPTLAEAIESVSITHNEAGRSGFQITFRSGRSGVVDLIDHRTVAHPQLRLFNRAIISVLVGARPRVLMDGIITNHQLSPSAEPGASTFTVTGEDVSVMMDLDEKVVEHPAQPELVIATKIIASYAQFGLIPDVRPPRSVDVPLPTQRIPVQRGTDLEYLREMANRFGFVFYVTAGPLPFSNRAYWGPPQRTGIPQRALSVNMGAETNVESISFESSGLEAVRVSGMVQDSNTNQKLPVETFASLRLPLAAKPALPFNLPNVRSKRPDQVEGLSYVQAFARAQGETDKSLDGVVTASGELDVLSYGDVLAPRSLVGLRGVGYEHDGFYYVNRVSHTLKSGSYRQGFTVTREGGGSTTPVVIP